jgi:predicted RNA-binding Zn ribbon-like protein
MGHEQRWGKIGGHVVLDLVDTISWRYDDVRQVDHTPDFATLTDWAADRGLIDAAEAGVLRELGNDPGAVRATETTHNLRDVVTLACEAALHGEPWAAPGSFKRSLQEALAHAEPGLRLPLRWLITIREPADLAWRLTLECAGFLGRPHPQLRACDGPGCGWLFLDTSRNHSRRWCDPADCGNRVRVARHAQAKRAIARS